MTNPRQRRQQQQLALISLEASRLQTLLLEAYTAVALTLPDGYPCGGSEPVSGGDIGNPTLGAVIAHEAVLECVEDRDHDRARQVGLAAVDQHLTAAVHALRDTHAALTQLTARLHTGRVAERTNIAECDACGRTVANTPNDRLRSGYCDACRKAWDRAGRPDRSEFARTRKGLDTAPEPEVRTSGVEVVDLTVNGTTVRLPAHLAVEFHALEQPTSDDIARLHAAALNTVS